MSKSSPAESDDPIGRLLSRLVAIAAILGIPAGLYGYFSAEHAKRVEKSFGLYDDFRSESFQKSWAVLIDGWNAKEEEARRMKETEDRDGLRKLATTIASSDDGRKAIAQVLGFFDGLSACVENSLCDRNTAIALLQRPAYQFAAVFGTHILFVRQTNRNQEYATGVFRVRALKRKCWIF